MFAGAAACFFLFGGVGPAAFAVLASLFVMTWASTRLGYRHKEELGLAESRVGRSARQVLANLAVPAMGAVLFGATGNRVWLVTTAAALAEAGSDTVASEIGQSFGRTACRIIDWKPVPAGTDGGVTTWGTVAGAFAAFVLAAIAAFSGMISPPHLWVAALAGFLGMLADSLLGATLQQRDWISNEGVNLLGTLIAAALALSLSP
jgi:uncharacterized protein (TIGR00297 family)